MLAPLSLLCYFDICSRTKMTTFKHLCIYLVLIVFVSINHGFLMDASRGKFIPYFNVILLYTWHLLAIIVNIIDEDLET